MDYPDGPSMAVGKNEFPWSCYSMRLSFLLAIEQNPSSDSCHMGLPTIAACFSKARESLLVKWKL